MAWSKLSFSLGSLLTAALMNQVASNFASVIFQESGTPSPAGTWSFAAASVINAPGSHYLGQISVGQISVGQISVGSGIAAPNVSSFDTLSVTSGFKLRGFPTRQLLQRVHVFDTTSRGTASAVFSTYTVASITPVSSLSSILVRAAIYVSIGANGSPSVLGSNLVRNPTVASSLALLTTSDGGNNGVMGQVGGGTVTGTNEVMTFERVDSAGNLDPKQYGVNWNRAVGLASSAIAGGTVTLEEWF